MSTKKTDKERIFSAAVELDAERRSAFLDAACGNDIQLRSEVESLLLHDAQASRFIEQPAVNRPATDLFRPITEGPGTVIGPYKLLQQIGEGGFGVVYMAEQQRPVRRKVALKIIKPGMDTREVVARFESERQALALMDHPNIARVLDGGTTDSGRPYFVMELVKGVPLTQFCDDNKLDTRQRLALFTTVCKAIQHAHHKGVIHRDIKPTNVMVTLHDGLPVPKVIDFGVSKAIAQQLTEKTMFTAYGQMIGTPSYMSPEQAEMSGLDIDTRSDVYSLGVLLYELLTGSTPLEANSLRGKAFAELQRMIREDEPLRPSLRISTQGAATATIAGNRGTGPRELGAILRGELDWIVMKALEKQRERRYESANSFAADVDRYLNHEAVEACPPSAIYRASKFIRRNRVACTTGAVVAASLLGGILISALAARDALYQRRLAEESLQVAFADRQVAEQAQKNTAVALETAERERDRAEKAKAEESNQRQLALAQKQAAEEAQQAAENAQQVATTERSAAVQERDRATKANAELARQKEQQRRMLYVAQMNLIQKAWDSGNIGRVRELLTTTRPRPGETDLRGIEWHYWQRMLHQDERTIKLPIQLATSSTGHGGFPGPFGPGGLPGPGGRGGRGVIPGPFGPDGPPGSFGRRGGPAIPSRIPFRGRGGGSVESATQAEGATSVLLSADGTRLAAIVRSTAQGNTRHTVQVWDTEVGSVEPIFSRELPRPQAANSLSGQRQVTLGGVVGFIDAERVVFTCLTLRTAAEGSPERNSLQVESYLYSLDSRPDTQPSPLPLPTQTGTGTLFAFTRDGSRIIAVTSRPQEGESPAEMSALILDGRTGEQVDTVPLALPFSLASYIAVNVDGSRLAVVDGESRRTTSRSSQAPASIKLAIVDLATKATAIVSPFSSNSELRVSVNFGAVAFSPDGKRLAVECVRSGLRAPPSEIAVFDAVSGEKLCSISDSTSLPPFSGRVASPFLAFSPDGTLLVARADEDTPSSKLRVWEAATGKLVVEFKGHTSPLRAAAFTADGTRIVAVDESGTIKVWRLSREAIVDSVGNSILASTLRGFGPDRRPIRSPDSRWTATIPRPSFITRRSSAGDESPTLAGDVKSTFDLTLEDTTGRVPPRKFELAGQPSSPRFSPDSQLLASLSLDPAASLDEAIVLHVWSVATGKLAITPPPRFPASEISSRSRDSATPPASALPPFPRASAIFSSDCQRLLITSRLATTRDKPFLRLWDVKSGRELPLAPALTTESFSPSFSPDGKWLLLVRSDRPTIGSAEIYSAETGELVWKVEGQVSLITFSPGGARLAAVRWESAGRDGGRARTVVVWDTATGEEIGTVPLPATRTVTALAVNHNGSRVAIVVPNSTIVYDVAAQLPLYTLDGAAGNVAFSPDGQRVVTWPALAGLREGFGAAQGQWARVWDSLTGQELLFATSESPLLSALTATSASGFAPLSAQVEAEGLVDWLSSADSDGLLLPRSQIVERIKTDSGISDEVRTTALKLAAALRRAVAPLAAQALEITQSRALPRDEYQRALDLINEVLEQAPDNDKFHAALGVCHYRLGDYAAALSALEVSHQLLKKTNPAAPPNALPYLAMSHHQLGHAELARKFFYDADRAASRLSPAFRLSSFLSPDRVSSSGRGSTSTTFTVSELHTEAAELLGLPAAAKLIAQGAALYDNQDYERAISAWSEAISTDPDNDAAYFLRGNARVTIKQYDQAIADYTRALELSPANVAYLARRSVAYDNQGNTESSIRDLSEVVRWRPTDAEAHNSLGILLKYHGDLDKAIASLDEAIRLRPSSNIYYNNRGQAWRWKGDLDKALADHNKALELDPKYALGYFQRGVAWIEKREFDKALSDLDQALLLDPKHADSYAERSNARRRRGEYELAREDAEAAIHAAPTRSAGYRARARLLAACPDEKYRDVKQAVADASKACDLSQWKNVVDITTLAAAHAENANFSEAVRCAEIALPLATPFQKSRLESSLALYREGKPYREWPASQPANASPLSATDNVK